MSVRWLVALPSLCLLGCIEGKASPDGVPDVQTDGPAARSDRPGPERGHPCPAKLASPVVHSFSVVDGIVAVPVNTDISLLVQASDASGVPLTYSYSVDPAPADPVTDNHDGTALWRLSSPPRPVFFTTPYTITVNVGYACDGGPSPASRSVRVKVWGNVLVADAAHHTIEALSSDGRRVGQVAGPAALTAPQDMVLLSATELAVGDVTPAKVKVIDLQTGSTVRLFAEVPDLYPYFLDRTPAGDVLVAGAGNKLLRFNKQGAVLQTITSPDTWPLVGLTHQSDGTILVGSSGGVIHAFNADGTYRGVFANPVGVDDVYSLLAIAGDEVLFGFLARFPEAGLKLIRLSKTGGTLGTVKVPDGFGLYSLRSFANGYLSVRAGAPDVYRVGSGLQLDVKPFATLPKGAKLNSIVWLDEPPP